MAGAMRKMAVYLGLVEDDEFEDDYLDDVEPDARDRPRPRGTRTETGRSGQIDSTRRAMRDDEDREQPPGRPARNWRVDTVAQEPVGAHPAGSRARLRAPARSAPRSDIKIRTLQPRSYNDARRVGEEFRSGNLVIVNLTELEDTDAKRIVDFAAGLVFGLRGSIERVTNKVFMLSPGGVDVTEARAQLAQDGLARH